MGDTHKQVLQSLDSAVALVDADDWSVLFENAKFFRWFPGTGGDDELLTTRMPDFRAERAKSRLEAGRPFKFEMKVTVEGREDHIRVNLEKFDSAGQPAYLLQASSIRKEMETQYMLDSYSKMAEKNARELEREKDRVERLLLNIMPRAVFEEMREFGTATPQRFEATSILMLDFVGFTDMAIAADPSAIIAELNDIFSSFDRITEMFDCERVRTIGDAYMAVSGLLDESPDHAANIARLALRFRRYLERRNQAHPQQWIARIGINTGSVIGSLVGVQKYVYDLFGPGVNLAARMESMSEPMKITVNEETYQRLKNEFVFTERGPHEIKGFGTQNLYYLDSELARR